MMLWHKWIKHDTSWIWKRQTLHLKCIRFDMVQNQYITSNCLGTSTLLLISGNSKTMMKNVNCYDWPGLFFYGDCLWNRTETGRADFNKSNLNHVKNYWDLIQLDLNCWPELLNLIQLKSLIQLNWSIVL